METMLMVYANAASDERYEEMNLWYSWCHIRDVLTNQAALAVQRFELSKYQPKNADTSHQVLTLYEVTDNDYCNRWHNKDAFTWRMRISCALGSDYYETHWNPICSTADWAEYADYKGERAVLAVKIKSKPGKIRPEEYFTLDRLKEMRSMHGFHAAHLFDWSDEKQDHVNPPPVEYADYNLLFQISNCYLAACKWDKYLDSHPEIEKSFELFPAIFEPMMRRIRDADLFNDPRDRALQAIAHMIQEDKDGRIVPLRTTPYDDPAIREFVNIERRNFRSDHTLG